MTAVVEPVVEPATDTPQWNTAGEVAAAIRELTAQAFLAESADNPHDPHQLSLSALGGCTKRAAFQVAGTPPSDVPPADEGRQANLGSWQHEGLLPRIAAQIAGAVVEAAVQLHAAGLVIPGRLDLAWPGVLMDLKTVGEHRLHGVLRAGEPYHEHRIQVMGYALARHQAGYAVKWVVWLYLDRASGQEEVMVERFTPAAALAVIDRVRHIRQVAEAGPDQARREARGPGLSYTCNSCPWLRRCWGPDARPGEVGAQWRLARTDPAVEAALALYDDARERESAAKRDKEFAAAMLARSPRGVYGPFELGRGKPGRQMDQPTVRTDYATRGEQLPMIETSPPLLVKRRKVSTDAARAT